MRVKILASLVVLTFAISQVSDAEEINEVSREDFLGTWLLDPVTKYDEWARVLVVNAEGFEICETEACENPLSGSEIRFIDDLIVLKTFKDEETTFKLVLGGYKFQSKKVLFGTRYHYDKGEIISGFSMVYKN